MEHKYLPTFGKAYFMVVAVLMYYFLTEVIDFGLFITYRHVFALILFASAFFDAAFCSGFFASVWAGAF